MKKFGESAIHDEGFNFYLTLEIQNKINGLIRDINEINECIKTHKEWSKEGFYNKKTTVAIHRTIGGYSAFSRFTLPEAQKLLKRTKEQYELLISLSENALVNILESQKSRPDPDWGKPYSEDPERLHVIVEAKD